MFLGNPLYNLTPATAPGLEGMRYMAADILSSFTGGYVSPYVPMNMGTFDATLAKHVNTPLYSHMMANVYRQMGQQLGNTAGAIGLVQQFGGLAGLTPEQTKLALSTGGAALGRGMLGSMVMPLVDQGLSGIGLTGGSLVAAANAAFSQRMSLMTPGTLFDPLSAGQQHQAMGAASAMASMLNGLMSQTTADGGLSLLPNLAVTKGFDRQRLARLAMRAAGAGAFNSYANIAGFDDMHGITEGGFEQRLRTAAGGMDLALLDYAQGDFTGAGRGTNSVLGYDAAKKVKTFTREFAHRMQGITEAMAAMRDLTHEVEGIEEKLDNLTNGQWLRSGRSGFDTRNAIRALQAVTQAYNLDPNAAITQIATNRSVLQAATGFDPAMQAMGFNGGGMFGLAAQTELLASIEDRVRAQGAQNDPILAGRIRMQGLQGHARNVNTVAGRAAQVLAYARQMGIVSDEEARYYQAAMTTGDRGVMSSAINSLLVTTFGSAQAGKAFMNDQMQMNAMQLAMDDNAGVFANQTIIRGAASEYLQQGMISLANQRLAATEQFLSGANLPSWQSDDDAWNLVHSVYSSIIENTAGTPGAEKGRKYAEAFRNQAMHHVAAGMSPLAAFNRVKESFARNPVTEAYTEMIEHAVARQSAVNNEERLDRLGVQGYQAAIALQHLRDADLIGKDAADRATEHLMAGRGKEAWLWVSGAIGELDPRNREVFDDLLRRAGSDYDAARRLMRDRETAEVDLAKAKAGHYSAHDVATAYEDVVKAARRYTRDLAANPNAAYDDFLEGLSQSKFALIFGDDALKRVIDGVRGGDANMLRDFGSRANIVRQSDVYNREASGYGSTLAGHWGGGAFRGNNAAAFDELQTRIDNLSRKIQENEDLSDGDRATLAQSLYGFFTGDTDWRGLLKIYDPDGEMTSRVKAYAAKFSRYEKLSGSIGDTYGKYRDALGKMTKDMVDGATVRDELMALIGPNGSKVLEASDVDVIRKRLEANNVGSEIADPILEYVTALADTHTAHREALDELDKLPDNKADVAEFHAFKERVKAGQAAAKAAAGDVATQRYLDELANDEDAINLALHPTAGIGSAWDVITGKISWQKKTALTKARKAVSDEEVAKALELESVDGVTDKQYMRGMFKALHDKAAAGDSAAGDILKMFKAVSQEGTQRISGELIIKNGNDQSSGVLEGNVAGSLNP